MTQHQRKNCPGTRCLAQLLDTSQPDTPGWCEDELTAIISHQLDVSLEDELGALPSPPATKPAAGSAPGSEIHTFRELLNHPHPPVEWLRCVKDYAKGAPWDADAPLPPPVAAVLYFVSIAAARVRLAESITLLEDAEVLDGMKWLKAQPWMTGFDELTPLIDRCLNLLTEDTRAE